MYLSLANAQHFPIRCVLYYNHSIVVGNTRMIMLLCEYAFVNGVVHVAYKSHSHRKLSAHRRTLVIVMNIVEVQRSEPDALPPPG